jgi:hypothetical protein
MSPLRRYMVNGQEKCDKKNPGARIGSARPVA